MKKHLTKPLAIIMALIMLFAALPMTAMAEEISGYYSYIVDDSGRAEIKDVDSAISGDVTIPSYIDGYKVIKIGEEAFMDCDNITSITIPDSVYYIGYRAFSSCGNLESLVIGDLVETIEDEAFQYCNKLINITWGNSLRNIGDRAFYNTGLTTLTIPDTVLFIGEDAFSATDITEIVIPDSVTYLGWGVFSDCSELESVTLSNSLECIPREAFYNCQKLTEINIPDNITTIEEFAFSRSPISEITIGKSLNYIANSAFSMEYVDKINIHDKNEYFSTDGQALYNKEKTILFDFYDETATSYTIPDGVERIEENAFYGGSSYLLKDIEIPESVISIGKDALAGTSLSLNSEKIDGLYYIGDILYSRDGYASTFTDTITVREGTRIIADGLFGYKYDGTYPQNIKMKEVILPESLVSIGNNAFLGCNTLEKINFPDSLIYIGDEAFYECNVLTDVSISDSVEYIGSNAFYGCSGITVTSLPDNLTYLGTEAFYGCKNNTDVILPNSVTFIGSNAFSNIVNISIPASVKVIEDDYIGKYTKLASINVDANNSNYSSENGVLFNKDKTKIITYPIAKTETKYVLPDTVLFIEASAFYGCKNLTEVILPDGLKEIKANAFSSSGITRIEIPDSVEKIEDSLSCDNLEEIIVHGTVEFVKRISGTLFYQNEENWENGMLILGGTLIGVDESSITEFVVPNTVKYLCENIFSMTTLTSVTIPDSVKSIPARSFHHSKKLKELRISDSVEYIGEGAFYDCDNLADIYYSGTAEQWKNIEMPSDDFLYSEEFIGADVHFVECIYTSDFRHSYTPEITTPATHIKEGVRTFTCKCGNSYTESIEKLPEHNHYASETIYPTCSTEGYTVYVCACGDSFINFIEYDYDAHVNEDGDGLCDYCGELAEHCSCNCHSTNSFIAFFWKLLNFFQKLFRTNPICKCGMAHY